jgi:hypothetical protein
MSHLQKFGHAATELVKGIMAVKSGGLTALSFAKDRVWYAVAADLVLKTVTGRDSTGWISHGIDMLMAQLGVIADEAIPSEVKKALDTPTGRAILEQFEDAILTEINGDDITVDELLEPISRDVSLGEWAVNLAAKYAKKSGLSPDEIVSLRFNLVGQEKV